MENLSLGWTFNSLNRDEISSRMLSDKNFTKRNYDYMQKFHHGKPRSPRFEQTDLKFSFYVNELKITL